MWDRPPQSSSHCPSLPLLLVWMDVSSLTPWLLGFHTVWFSVSSGCLLFLNLLLSFFWLCEEAQCVYLCLRLGRKSMIDSCMYPYPGLKLQPWLMGWYLTFFVLFCFVYISCSNFLRGFYICIYVYYFTVIKFCGEQALSTQNTLSPCYDFRELHTFLHMDVTKMKDIFCRRFWKSSRRKKIIYHPSCSHCLY